MNPATLVVLLQALASFATEVPALVSGAKLAADLITSGRAPTANEQATIDAALDAAHERLQAAQPGG